MQQSKRSSKTTLLTILAVIVRNAQGKWCQWYVLYIVCTRVCNRAVLTPDITFNTSGALWFVDYLPVCCCKILYTMLKTPWGNRKLSGKEFFNPVTGACKLFFSWCQVFSRKYFLYIKGKLHYSCVRGGQIWNLLKSDAKVQSFLLSLSTISDIKEFEQADPLDQLALTWGRQISLVSTFHEPIFNWSLVIDHT